MPKAQDIPLWLIRSGATEWDDARRLQGTTDLPLAEAGVAALRQTIADELAHAPTRPVTVHTAPDEASVQTARIVNEVSCDRSAKVRTVASLRAVSMGLWEGLLEDELLSRHPRKFKAWREHPANVLVPEGEALLDGQARLLTGLSKLAEKGNGSTLAVVLRPMEHALVRCLLDGDSTDRLWGMLEDAPLVQVRSVNRSVFRSLLTSMHAAA